MYDNFSLNDVKPPELRCKLGLDGDERIDITETPEEEWLSKQDFHNGADQAYTG